MGSVYSKLYRKSTGRSKLPLELLVIIEQFLIGDNAFRTAANLNSLCRIVHEETLPILFAVAVWQYDYFVRWTHCHSDRRLERSYQHFVKFLILDNVVKEDSILCDTYAYTDAFPNLKAVLVDNMSPSGMPFPFTNADYSEGYTYENGTTLAVFKPTSCRTICELIQSYSSTRIERNGLTKTENQMGTRVPSPRPRLLIAHLRLRSEGKVVEDSNESLASGLKPLVDHRSFVIDLGDERLPQLVDGALGPCLSLGDTEPHDGTWKIDIISHISNVPDMLISVARRHWKAREESHLVLLRPSLLYKVSRDTLLDQWVAEYLIARRRFYDESSPDMKERSVALWEQNASIDWHGTDHAVGAYRQLKERNIEPMIRIRVSQSSRAYLLIWNADLRSSGGDVLVNDLGAIETWQVIANLYSEKP